MGRISYWFTPGLFMRRGGESLADRALDAGYFNVVHEFYPSTSQQFKFDRRGALQQTGRPSRVPTYGTWQGILPDRRLYTVALARGPALLETFGVGQTYLLGKKRTMMQVTKLSEIVQGEKKHGTCQTSLLQLAPDAITLFRTFDVVAATMRYLILHGETRVEDGYVEFDLPGMLHSGAPLALPRFYLQETPIGQRGT